MLRTVASEDGTWLPDFLLPAHDLCFLHHDVLVELLRTAEESEAFTQEFEFRDASDRSAFESSAHALEWLARTGRTRERADFLRRFVFPALLSDMLHFIYEALDCSRAAKLNVTYALIRKPLQENLFLLETIATDVEGFAEKLAANPMYLRAQKAGGLDAHERRISDVLAAIGESDRFDARYLAQLRYDRAAEDGFDGMCNQAVHLFTEHKAIKTAPLSVNFIFSGEDEKQAQWYLLYSRLPYLLDYARQVVEHVYRNLALTDPVYIKEMERRSMASTLLWAPAIDPHYKSPELDRYVSATNERLRKHCRDDGYECPTVPDLKRMRDTGAYPGESMLHVRLRRARYIASAWPRAVVRLLNRIGKSNAAAPAKKAAG